MNGGLMKASCDAAGTMQYIPPSKRQQLQQQKDALEAQLKKVDAALSALDAHPELEQFIDTLQNAGL